MSGTTIQRRVANICMQMVRQYHNDLAEYYAGDEARFSRMVVDQGKSLPSATPQGWAQHINNLAIECADYHADELRLIFAQLRAWGLSVDDTILGEAQPCGTH